MQSSFVSGHEKIQKSFGNDFLSHTHVFRWHRDFVNERETAEVEPRSGRRVSVRTSTNVGRVRAFIR
jgi:hypothetical protein